MDPRGLRMTQNAYFLFLTPNKQLLLMILCDLTVEIGASFWTNKQNDGQNEGWIDRCEG